MPKKTAPSTLTGHAKKIWESAYEAAWEGYDPKKAKAESQEAYAASVAWAAVKKAGYKKDKKSGKWVKKSLALNLSFSLRITKARHDEKTGRVRWHAQAANDEIDGEGEGLDPSIFTDFAENFQTVMAAYSTNVTPPDFGHGLAQLPILDVSHYSSLLSPEYRDKACVGSIVKLYRDGRFLHADGFFAETEIGKRAAAAVMADEEGILRTSVGFYPDWGNIRVKDDVLVFEGGRGKAYLDHIAITSVPRIKSTTLEAEMEEVTMSEAISMAEDALAVLGDEEIVEGLEQLVSEELQEQRSMVLRSEEEEVEQETVEPEVEPVEEEVEQEIDQEIEAAAEYVDAVVEEEVTRDVAEIDAALAKGKEPESKIEEVVEQEQVLSEVVVTETEQDEEELQLEADVGGPDTCVCPDCDYSTDKVRGTPCRDMECSKCGASLVAGKAKEKSEALVESEVTTLAESDVSIAVPVESIEIIKLPFGGATSFDDAVEYEEALKEGWRVEDGWYFLRTVISNIFADDGLEDKKAAIATALDQYTAFLQSGESLMSEAADVEPEVVEAVEPVAEEEPAVEGLVEGAIGGETEDLEDVTLSSPAPTTGPPEAQPMSVVEDVEASLGSKAVKSFGEALAKLNNMDVPVARKQQAVAELAQVAEREIQRELVTDANVEELVEGAVSRAMEPVGIELAQIRELLTQQSVPGSQDQTPRRPVRKSYSPNILPAKVTTQAQTFSDVIDRLLS